MFRRGDGQLRLSTTVNFNTVTLSDLTRLTAINHESLNKQNARAKTSTVSAEHPPRVTDDQPKEAAVIVRPQSEKVSGVAAAQASVAAAKEEHFYRRELPLTCIAFASTEGRQVFREALQLGYMEAFFTLGPQLTTQDEPAFCGLASLVVALNALQVDPGRVWKGRWRWYHETMLDCCVPLGRVVRNGITLHEFASIAECNAVQTHTRLADATLSIEELRATIRDCTSRNDRVLVCAYARGRVQQTGEGHFAPIGGYHPERDLVLVLDTARFKYPPHWLPVSLLLEAMRAPDRDAGGRPRGFCVLGKPSELHNSSRTVQLHERLSSSVSPLSRCHARTNEVRRCPTCGYPQLHD